MTGFTPLAAFSMLVFILLYVPCVAATSTMLRELGSAKWTAFSVVWQIGVAYAARSSFTPSGCCWGWGKIRCGGI